MRAAKRTLILTVAIVLLGQATGQAQRRVAGFVRDRNSGELLIGATVVDTLTNKGVTTDNNGYFAIVSTAKATLQFSFLGYRKHYLPVGSTADTLVNILLEPATAIDEVVVTASRYKTADVSTLSTKQMFDIPAIGGKPDIAKALQLLPGIGTQNEGSSMLLVRGGDPGQNLYLFDNVPVVYVNHLGGFFSVFNPEIINHIDVFKGGFPSRYGGKLSSIVDITQREGDASGPKGSISIGLTDLSFSAEGPLKLKNTTFIITGRKTLIDPIMALFTRLSDGNDFVAFYGFHDLNGKLTWKLNARNTFSLNLYYGDDYLTYMGTEGKSADTNFRFSNTWGNWLVSAHWKAMISNDIFASTALSYTRYRLRETQKFFLDNQGNDNEQTRKTTSSVENVSLKTELKYTPFANWTIGFGGEATLSNYLPFHPHNTSKTGKRTLSGEGALFVDNTISFLSHSKLQAGARLVGYGAKGYGKVAFEPRVSANLGLGPNHSLTLSYMKVHQFSHLLFTTGGIMNNEVWIPSDSRVSPSSSTQYSAGWAGSFRGGMFTAEAVGFYKTLSDLSTYKEGYTSLSGDVDWLSKVETGGSGVSKGIEISIKKNTGDLTGFISYSLSNTTRQYPGINGGRRFLFDYDRLNQFAISGSYRINDRLRLSATWTYMTGLPYTPAIGLTTVPSLTPNLDGEREYYEALLYGERNSARMRDYHRLDIGLTYEKVTKRGRRALWNFSVYNVYNRNNPYRYYYNTHDGDTIIHPEYEDSEESPLSLYQISFFPIVPTASYTLFFDGSRRENRQKKTAKERLRNLLYFED